ncbi:MAG: FecR domain-containing protein [Gammaproteobacteria bacterium]
MAKEQDTLTSISEQATRWWITFHNEGATPADHQEFGEWAARGPDRVEAYLRMAGLQRALEDRRLRWPVTPAGQLIREAKELPPEVARLKPAVASPPQQPSRSGRVARRVGFGLAASLVLAVGFVWVMLTRPQQFQTAFGEQRSFLLDDGSRVTLNTASKIEVRLRGHRRQVYLAAGEALFEVAHDPSRPFDVRTGNAVLRAVGTQFDVDRRPGRTIVTIVEGRVAMLSAGASPAGGVLPPLLVAADRVVITDEGAPALRHGVNLAAALSWTQRQLSFEHRPLAEVAEEFNRYNRERIEIRSAALRAQEVTGTFQSNDVASFVAFLSGIPGVRIESDGRGGHIVSVGPRP